MDGHPTFLHASAAESFVPGRVVSSHGLRYVPFQRSYDGLPVVGGDFVVVADGTGRVVDDSVTMSRPIGTLPVTPALDQATAAKVAVGQIQTVTKIEGTQLVVDALGATPRLAWESIVDGTGPDGTSRLSVDVDASTGAVLRTQEHVMPGRGD